MEGDPLERDAGVQVAGQKFLLVLFIGFLLVFLIGGRAPIARWGMGSLQEMDQVEVVKSLTKKALTLESPEEAYGLAAECMRTALSRRTGPVFMDVPIDTFMFGAADVPEATDTHGRLMQKRGVTPSPGLYTLGLTWQHTRGSALLGWVGADAAYLAEHIARGNEAQQRAEGHPTARRDAVTGTPD